MYKELLKLNNKKQRTQFKKWAKDLGRHFPKDIHTDYKQMKGYTSSIIIWGTKLKPYWYTTTSHSVGWLLSKHTHTKKISQKISIGKDVEKLGPLDLAGSGVKRFSHCGELSCGL